MQWEDEGRVVGARRHGEADLILEVLTRTRGRHLGLVRGGRGRRLAPTLQAGNTVALTWRARLDEHLGTYQVEGLRLRAGGLIDDGFALAALAHLAFLIRLLAERDPHETLYAAATIVADRLGGEALVAAALLARFELAVLSELGFGLDLSACAATGSTQDLVYVSPRSGRAVSRAAGAAWHDRLLPLPAFLTGGLQAGEDAVCEAFRLTGYFLERDVTGPRGLALPAARARIASLLSPGAAKDAWPRDRPEAS